MPSGKDVRIVWVHTTSVSHVSMNTAFCTAVHRYVKICSKRFEIKIYNTHKAGNERVLKDRKLEIATWIVKWRVLHWQVCIIQWAKIWGADKRYWEFRTLPFAGSNTNRDLIRGHLWHASPPVTKNGTRFVKFFIASMSTNSLVDHQTPWFTFCTEKNFEVVHL